MAPHPFFYGTALINVPAKDDAHIFHASRAAHGVCRWPSNVTASSHKDAREKLYMYSKNFLQGLGKDVNAWKLGWQSINQCLNSWRPQQYAGI